MPVPSSVVKLSKNGVEYTSNVDACNYLMRELMRAALRDVGRFVKYETSKKLERRTGRGKRSLQVWIRKKEIDMQIGYKPEGFYMGFIEIGTLTIKKQAPLTSTVEENIATIREIQAQYLSAINDGEVAAAALIDEGEYNSDNEPD